METFKKLMLCILLTTGAILAPSCSKNDEPDDPNKPENVDPNKPVADPVGTVTMRMRNDNETKLGSMILSPENNFSCKAGMIASIGPVSGLGNITDIPLTGWSDNVAVTIGNGYVYYDGNQYYRIYATQWLIEAGTANAIIGVELKYQSPFKGVDEELVPETAALSFSDEGGTDELRFTNTSVIPFTVKCDDDWCRVSRWASADKDETFLYDGISVTVLPNEEMEETRTKITLQTLYGKRTVINVVRSGQAPTVIFPNGETEYTLDVNSAESTHNISLTTNIEEDDFQAISGVDWIVVDEVRRNVPSRAMRNTTLRFSVLSNYNSTEREGKITLSSKKGEKTSVLTIRQQGAYMWAEDPIEVTAATTDATVNFETGVDGTYTVTSSATWCKVVSESRELNAGRFAVRLELEPNTTEKDRTAVITASANGGSLKAQTQVIQKGVSYENVPKTIYFTRVHQNMQITLPVTGLTVKSDASWCQTVVDGFKLTVLVDDSTEDRTATLTIDGTSVKITVDQSKYAVGDDYNEKGIKGTVCLMDGDKRLVRSADLGKAAYSTESFTIGATDPDNGMANMSKVKSLSSWKSYYPAFALCDELNVDGVTGWYLPARNENVGLSSWTSTEIDDTHAYSRNSRTNTFSANKSSEINVYAVHLFVK